MIYNERDTRTACVIEAARLIMTAARTAPKGKGVDIIEMATLTGDDLTQLAEAMRKRGEELGRPGFIRDAGNVEQSQAVILLGTHRQPLGLNCAYCGAKTCGENPEAVPCAINSIDVGIAIGSACATAADLRIDSRVMYSAGYVAHEMNLLPDCHQLIALLLSVSSKSPFFDRNLQMPRL